MDREIRARTSVVGLSGGWALLVSHDTDNPSRGFELVLDPEQRRALGEALMHEGGSGYARTLGQEPGPLPEVLQAAKDRAEAWLMDQIEVAAVEDVARAQDGIPPAGV